MHNATSTRRKYDQAMCRKIKKLYNQILSKKIVLFFHTKSKKKLFLAIDNQSMSMGSAACNDLILLCTSVAEKSGQMIAQKAGCFLHMANGHRHRLGWKPYQLGLYRIYVAKLLPLLLVMIGLVILGCTFS
ncbi:MAG: hypothetical protein R3A45_06825 [Bdellovibrionota bacterium]